MKNWYDTTRSLRILFRLQTIVNIGLSLHQNWNSQPTLGALLRTCGSPLAAYRFGEKTKCSSWWFHYIRLAWKMLPICFHCYLRRHCTMHTLNLGIYLTVNAEGLLMLAALRVSQYQYCNLDEALSHLYDDFRDWCTANRTTCSQRRWCSKQLHLESDGVHTFPWLHSKAFNARVILGWLADPCLKMIIYVPRATLFPLFPWGKHPSWWNL